MDITTKIKQTNRALASEIDDEVVMFDADAGQYYGLNSVASAVWKQVKNPASVAEVCDQLVELYDIEKEQCISEVLSFLPDLHKKGLIEIVEE